MNDDVEIEQKNQVEMSKKEEELKIKIPSFKKRNFWMISTIFLIIVLVGVLIFFWNRMLSTSDNILKPEEAAVKIVEFINENLVQPGTEASFVSVDDFEGVYNVTLSYQGRDVSVFSTKDGSYMFLSAPLDITKELPQPEQPQEQQQPTQPTTQVSVDDDPSKGSEDAPVTIIEFSDFQCPYCARFYTQTLPQIQSEYIDTGKVKLVYRDFPLSFHQYAQKAAEASECADEQGKFWEYHDKLFENQQALDVNSLKQYAKDLGLDSTQFDSCLDDGKYASEVQKDFQDGQNYGVSGTPAFFINGQLISGAQPFSTFKQIIDAELAK